MRPIEPIPEMQSVDSLAVLILEWLTGGVLLLVLASLGWMAVADMTPTLRLPSLESEILGVLALLTAALLLVSVLALLRTRDRSAP